MKNILELLEQSAKLNTDKIAFIDKEKSITYSELISRAKKIGSAISEKGIINRPIAIYIDKSIECLIAMFGVLYSGNFYVIIDTNMPDERIQNIYKTLNPVLVIFKDKKGLVIGCDYLNFQDLSTAKINEDLLNSIREKMIDTDPAYALFTSGSTGVPKGAVVSHRSVIAYSRWVTETFGINQDTIFGNQTPFYFSMSVLDIYSTIRAAATMLIIPKSYFSFPLNLLEFLKNHKVNTLYWVPSALGIIANWRALDYFHLPDIKTLLFAGEVMPIKYMNYWRKHYPNALMANLFGPTEVTDICTYYVVEREFSDDDTLPIGKACNNCDVFVVDEKGNKVDNSGNEGELYVRGSFLAHGYYNNSQKTQEAFVQNPLNSSYPEIVYRTGDIVRYNKLGELEYIGRKDFQIKHMGYRIELGEIEAAAYAAKEIISVCCLYSKEQDEIIMVYEGRAISEKMLSEFLSDKIPDYMLPNKIFKVDIMPHNANGKIDRALLMSKYK